MLTTAVIAFREFLEAFLIVGVFLGISRKLKLRKGLEIGFAAAVGVLLSLLLAIGTYVFGDHARVILTEKNADALESYLLIFSGVFISYVVFSLHDLLRKSRGGSVLLAHRKLQQRELFDVSLFATIAFLVLREGFEIALFTASVALFSEFTQNVLGLLLGFAAAAVLGLSTFFAYIRLPLGKVFRATEYMIILLGASLTQHGVTLLLETNFSVRLSDMLSFHLSFLPGEDSLLGHLLQGFLGVDREFSLVRLTIMILYIGMIYAVFLRKKKVRPDLPISA